VVTVINLFVGNRRFTPHLNHNYYQVLLSGIHSFLVLTLILFWAVAPSRFSCIADIMRIFTVFHLWGKFCQYSSHVDDAITLNRINVRSCYTEQIFSEGLEDCVCKSVELYRFLVNATVNQNHNKKKGKSYWKLCIYVNIWQSIDLCGMLWYGPCFHILTYVICVILMYHLQSNVFIGWEVHLLPLGTSVCLLCICMLPHIT
jgi:hypothetical protein